MKTSVILNFGFAKKAQFSDFSHNFSRGIQKSWSQEPGTTSWGSNEKTYFNDSTHDSSVCQRPPETTLSYHKSPHTYPFDFFLFFQQFTQNSVCSHKSRQIVSNNTGQSIIILPVHSTHHPAASCPFCFRGRSKEFWDWEWRLAKKRPRKATLSTTDADKSPSRHLLDRQRHRRCRRLVDGDCRTRPGRSKMRGAKEDGRLEEGEEERWKQYGENGMVCYDNNDSSEEIGEGRDGRCACVRVQLGWMRVSDILHCCHEP